MYTLYFIQVVPQPFFLGAPIIKQHSHTSHGLFSKREARYPCRTHIGRQQRPRRSRDGGGKYIHIYSCYMFHSHILQYKIKNNHLSSSVQAFQ